MTREIDIPAAQRNGDRGTAASATASRGSTPTIHVAETIMALSGTTNGHLATQGFKTLEKRTGNLMHDLAAEHEGKMITFADTVAAPVPVITSPEWSGSETGGRRYSPFTINVERLQALAHPDRAQALLPRPRLDAGAGRGAARRTGRRST